MRHSGSSRKNRWCH